MTFTELEVVLGLGIIALLYINNRLSKEIDARQRDRERIVEVLIGVADKRYRLQRLEEGVKVINLEDQHGKTNQQT